MGKLLDLESGIHQLIINRAEPLVHCHGVFDVLHAGHLAYFKAAKAYGKLLIVTVTSDRHVSKGPGRPHFKENIRAEMLAALEIVDFVAISDHPTAVPAIDKLKPDFYVKGPDYKDHAQDVTGEIKNEVEAVMSHGGKVIYTDAETHSSSQLANKFFVSWSDEQRKTIEQVKSLGGLELITKYLDECAKLTVTVIGESIKDVYRFCEPQNISSKSPSISARFLYEEAYDGGADAIANHVMGFCDVVHRPLHLGPAPNYNNLPTKIRYISADKQQRIFEITHIDNENWDHAVNVRDSKICVDLSDLAIVADFGHGLIEGEFLEYCNSLHIFKALNVQTNSSNYGFNPYHKHDSWDYLVLDRREIHMGFQNNRQSPAYQASVLSCNRGMRSCLGLTLGSAGAEHFINGMSWGSPAFTDQVVDATGAGDAYFAITSLLVKIGAKPEIITFVGNVFAGLKTKIIGNKSAVTKAQLLKALAGILK